MVSKRQGYSAGCCAAFLLAFAIAAAAVLHRCIVQPAPAWSIQVSWRSWRLEKFRGFDPGVSGGKLYVSGFSIGPISIWKEETLDDSQGDHRRID